MIRKLLPRDGSVTAFTWQDHLDIGVSTIDADHRRIASIIQRIAAPAPDDEPLPALIDKLGRAVADHIADEEARLRRLGHPGADELIRQRREQERALRAVLAVAVQRGRLPPETLEYLGIWLLHHVVCQDLPLRDFLMSKGLRDASGPRLGWVERLGRRLDILGLRWRILLLALLPLLAVLLAAAGLGDRLDNVRAMRAMRDSTEASTRIGALVHDLQRERGLSALHVTRPSGEAKARLDAQRGHTDARRAVLASLAGRASPAMASAEAGLARLDALRRGVDAGGATGAAVVDGYAAVIADLLRLVQQMVHAGTATDLGSDGAAYVLLMRSKERAGLERAIGSAGLAGGSLDDPHRRLHALAAEQDLLEELFLSVAAPETARAYRAMLGPVEGFAALRRRLLASFGQPAPVSGAAWFDAATERMEAMKRVEDVLAEHIIAQAGRLHDQARRDVLWLSLAMLVLLAGVVAPSVVLAASVVPPLAALHRTMRRLAAGDHTAPVPGLDLRDEIGAMARTVQSFREGLIARDLLSLEARLEVSGLVRSIADNLPGIVFQKARTADGGVVCTYVSDQVRRYTGQTAESLVGRQDADPLLAAAAPEDRDRVGAAMAAAFASGGSVQTELRVFAPDGTAAWLRLAMVPRVTGHGAMVWDGIALDISELKDSERQRVAAADRLRQLYKLQALTQMAGGMAHEINNLLQPIIGLSELALMTLPDGSKTKMYIEHVLAAGEQARDLVAKITSFSRIEPLRHGPVNLAEAVAGAVDLLENILPRNVVFQTALRDPDLMVGANAGELQQALMNLCTNAAHAIGPNRGTIALSTGRDIGPDGSRWGVVEVRDTGCGIPADIIEHIFDPFFTTKEVGQGTGLGLALVHAIVTGFGGQVTVQSQVGHGTTFRLLLPEAIAAPVEGGSSSPARAETA